MPISSPENVRADDHAQNSRFDAQNPGKICNHAQNTQNPTEKASGGICENGKKHMTHLEIPETWQNLPFFMQKMPDIQSFLETEATTHLPSPDLVFAALHRSPPDKTRVVILGQDPYPTPGHANGLAFSVTPQTKPLPRSLNNIYKELDADLGAHPPNGDLGFWADQGVLLLNTALTVMPGDAGAHAKIGWSALTEQVLHHLSDRPRAFLLWGKHAQGFAKHIQGTDHLILQSAHPSPLSARRGFFGSRPFSRINDWLKAIGETEINWTTPGGPI